jgi:ElaB/YqjD/DUF883 family membrane-anchored ribosome-binding protein
MATRTTKTQNKDNDQSDLIANLQSQIESLQSDVHALIKSVTNDNEPKNMFDNASEAIAQTTQKSAEEAAKEVERVENLIKEQPLKSVALALGAGVALALLARR